MKKASVRSSCFQPLPAFFKGGHVQGTELAGIIGHRRDGVRMHALHLFVCRLAWLRYEEVEPYEELVRAATGRDRHDAGAVAEFSSTPIDRKAPTPTHSTPQ